MEAREATDRFPGEFALLSQQRATALETAWTDADFSWEGLGKHSWHGWAVTTTKNGEFAYEKTSRITTNGQILEGTFDKIRDAKLKDYWRTDLKTGRLRSESEMGEEIATLDGEKYHIVHLPRRYRGEPVRAKRRLSESIREIVENRLAHARKTIARGAVVDRMLVDCERRCILDGAVLDGLSVTPRSGLVNVHLRANNCLIEGDVSISGMTILSDLEIQQTLITGEIAVESCGASAPVLMNDCVITQVNIHRSTFAADIVFDRTVVARNLRLSTVQAEDNLAMRGCAIGRLSLYRVSVGRMYWVQRAAERVGVTTPDEQKICTRLGIVKIVYSDFHGCLFDGVVFTDRLQFSRCVVREHASFEAVKWPTLFAHYSRAFAETAFQANVSFAGSGFCALAAFAHARFEGNVSFDSLDDRSALTRMRSEADAAAQEMAPSDSIEAGCRALKLAMRRDGFEDRVQQFYKLELLSRELSQSTSSQDRFVSRLYGLISGYGTSIFAPLAALLISIIGFGMLYWMWAGAGPAHAIEEGMAFSAMGAFKPFSVYDTASATSLDLTRHLLADSAPLRALAVKAVSSLQSVVSLVFVFLFGLAIKRKFQLL